MSARSKSFTALQATTSLSVEEALDGVRRATRLEGERGIGKVEGQLKKGPLRVLIAEESETGLSLKVAMDQSQRGNLAFDATAEPADGGSTRLQVGGLTHCQVIQSKLFGLIPMGPDSIVHFGFYRKFLDRVSEELLAEDPEATVTIGIYEEEVLRETGP